MTRMNAIMHCQKCSMSVTLFTFALAWPQIVKPNCGSMRSFPLTVLAMAVCGVLNMSILFCSRLKHLTASLALLFMLDTKSSELNFKFFIITIVILNYWSLLRLTVTSMSVSIELCALSPPKMLFNKRYKIILDPRIMRISYKDHSKSVIGRPPRPKFEKSHENPVEMNIPTTW